MTSLERSKQVEGRFRQTLDAAETSFAEPADAAAPREWVRACVHAVERLQPALEDMHRLHRAEFAEIEREDLGLEPRVEELRGREAILLEEGRSLAERFAALSERSARGDSDRDSWRTELSQAAEEGLEWISDVREQHLAIRTWLVEAVTRDRGVVD